MIFVGTAALLYAFPRLGSAVLLSCVVAMAALVRCKDLPSCRRKRA